MGLSQLTRRVRIAFARLSQPVRATVFMLSAMLLFTSMGVFIRLSANELHTLQVVFFRNFFALILLSPLLMRSGLGLLKSQHMGLYWLRSGINIIGMAAGFTAITLIPLAEATALGFTAPLFTTIGAVIVLSEVIRLRRMIALAVGFAGVLIVVGPNIAGMSLGASLALTNAVLLAATALIVKRLTTTEPVEAIIIWMVLLSTPMAFIPALFVWQWPSAETLFWLVCLAGAGSVGHFCWTRACSLADMTQLQPLEFVKLPFTALAGFLIFYENPALAVWIGGAVIFMSTAYITRREAQIARAQRSRRDTSP